MLGEHQNGVLAGVIRAPAATSHSICWGSSVKTMPPTRTAKAATITSTTPISCTRLDGSWLSCPALLSNSLARWPSSGRTAPDRSFASTTSTRPTSTARWRASTKTSGGISTCTNRVSAAMCHRAAVGSRSAASTQPVSTVTRTISACPRSRRRPAWRGNLSRHWRLVADPDGRLRLAGLPDQPDHVFDLRSHGGFEKRLQLVVGELPMFLFPSLDQLSLSVQRC